MKDDIVFFFIHVGNYITLTILLISNIHLIGVYLMNCVTVAALVPAAKNLNRQ